MRATQRPTSVPTLTNGMHSLSLFRDNELVGGGSLIDRIASATTGAVGKARGAVGKARAKASEIAKSAGDAAKSVSESATEAAKSAVAPKCENELTQVHATVRNTFSQQDRYQKEIETF